MNDDEIVIKFQNDVLNLVNSCRLPLSVRSVVLENILLKVNFALQKSDSQEESKEEVNENG